MHHEWTVSSLHARRTREALTKLALRLRFAWTEEKHGGGSGHSTFHIEGQRGILRMIKQEMGLIVKVDDY